MRGGHRGGGAGGLAGAGWRGERRERREERRVEDGGRQVRTAAGRGRGGGTPRNTRPSEEDQSRGSFPAASLETMVPNTPTYNGSNQ